jgi:hypothetical protein
MLSTPVLKRIISLVCISIVSTQGEQPHAVSGYFGAGLTIASVLEFEDGKKIIFTIHVSSIGPIKQMRGRFSFPKALGMIREILFKDYTLLGRLWPSVLLTKFHVT